MSFTSGINKQYLYKVKADIIDTAYNSEYFQIIDLKEVYSIGRHIFGLRGSLKLKPGSEINGELLDQRKQIVKLYALNQDYCGRRGIATLGFEIEESTVQGDLFLVLTGETRDGKVVKWSRLITAITEYTEIEERFGGAIDLPYGRPVEVQNLSYQISSGSYAPSGSSSVYNIELNWYNHLFYSTPYETSQSQGSGGTYRQTDPTQSKLTEHQLKNISEYHIFLFQPDTASGGTFLDPPGYPNYYPGRQDPNTNMMSGNWFWVDSIPAPQGVESIVLNDSGLTQIKANIDYVITGLPQGYEYYAYVAMTTEYTLNRWVSSFWSLISKGKPTK